jgi:hypothetical protein
MGGHLLLRLGRRIEAGMQVANRTGRGQRDEDGRQTQTQTGMETGIRCDPRHRCSLTVPPLVVRKGGSIAGASRASNVGPTADMSSISHR